jgi:hypothetical protein
VRVKPAKAQNNAAPIPSATDAERGVPSYAEIVAYICMKLRSAPYKPISNGKKTMARNAAIGAGCFVLATTMKDPTRTRKPVPKRTKPKTGPNAWDIQ